MRDDLVVEFGEDLPIVSARYYMQLADLYFILHKYQECQEAADKGIEQVQLASKNDEDIEAHMNNTRRDLINLKLRSMKKITPTVNIEQLRVKEGTKYGLDQTLLPSEPLHDVEKDNADASQLSIKQNVEESAEEAEEDDIEEGFSMKSASLLFGAVSVSTAALTYLAVSNKK